MATAFTLKHIKDAIHADSYSVKDGVFTLRRTFFFTSGRTAEGFAAAIKVAFPTAILLEQGEVWKRFSGGASVANSSHWFVKFRVPASAQAAA